MFAEKARNAQKAGAIGGIVIGKVYSFLFTYLLSYIPDIKIMNIPLSH